VTGDDFGASSAVNSGILEAHRNGVLTTASLMVTGEAWEEAVALARANPNLAVGLHLVLADGRPALDCEEIPHLVDARGRFPASPLRCGLRYQFHRSARRELRREIREQLERFRGTGLALSHVDGHHHLHLHPFVLSLLAEFAAEFRIPAIRLPDEELGITLALDRRNIGTKVAWSWIFRRLRVHGERRLAKAGVRFSDRVYGLLATGRITEEYLLGLIPRIDAKRIELYSHPSRSPAGSGPEELAALVSTRVREALAANGFVLTTYAGAFGPTSPPGAIGAARES
jgi:chitin disaccharide deacetylase